MRSSYEPTTPPRPGCHCARPPADAPGLADEVVAGVRERFRGARRNPFDEAECGHHYARALASWGLVMALTGFGYDGRAGTMKFAAAKSDAVWFWSNGAAWGTLSQGPGPAATLTVLHGSVLVRRVLIGGQELRPPRPGLPAAVTSHELTADRTW
jgi:hypothetical protein